MRKLTTMILFFLTLGVVNAQEPNTLEITKTNASVLKVFIDDIDHISYTYNTQFEMVVEAETTTSNITIESDGTFETDYIILWSNNAATPMVAAYTVTVPDETAYSFTLKMKSFGPNVIVPLSLEVNGVDQGTADVAGGGVETDVIFTGINLNSGSNTIKFSTGVIPVGKTNVSLPFDSFTITAY